MLETVKHAHLVLVTFCPVLIISAQIALTTDTGDARDTEIPQAVLACAPFFVGGVIEVLARTMPPKTAAIESAKVAVWLLLGALLGMFLYIFVWFGGRMVGRELGFVE